MQAWLGGTVAEKRDHREIGADPQFTLRGLLPVPFQQAITRVALSQGWCTESFLIAILSNIGWLEHSKTRLREVPGELHGRTPNIPCTAGPQVILDDLLHILPTECRRGPRVHS